MESLKTAAPIVPVDVPLPAAKELGGNPLGKEERDKEAEENKPKGIEIEITGDEDIDANLLNGNRRLSQL